MQNLLVTNDGKTLLFYFPSNSFTTEFTNSVLKTVHSLDACCDEVAVGGSGTLALSMNKYLYSDLTNLLLLGFFVILIIFYVSFRSNRAVLNTLVLSSIGIIWTIGTMVLLGYELTLVNIVIPCMVLILGSSYSVHILNEYFRMYHENGNHTNLDEAYVKIGKTIFMACFTTAIGFLSLLVCEIQTFREMGISVSFGIFYCAILSITLIPAWLNLIKEPRTIQIDQYKIGFFTKMEKVIPAYVTNHYKVAIFIFAFLIVGFGFTHNKIETDTNYMEYFPQEDQNIINFKKLAVSFGSTTPYYIILDAPNAEKNYFKDSVNLKKVYDFETALQTQAADIIHITSISQYVAFLNNVYSGKSEIPDSNGLINMMSRYLVLIENNMKGESSLISDLMNKDGNRIKLQINYFDSEKMNQPSIQCAQRLNDAIEGNKNLLGDDVQIVSWSDASEGLHVSNIIKTDQAKSTFISFILVLIFVTILFKSFTEGLYTMIPVLTGILGNYIFMYLTGIPFDIITAVFTSIVVGIGVDDSIHFMNRYNSYQKVYPDYTKTEIIEMTLKETIRPITLTSVSIIGGMLVMLFASYSPIRYFGLLLAFALLLTTLSTLILLPSTIILVENIKSKFRK
jgi:predicted RND superfamily exporter protein